VAKSGTGRFEASFRSDASGPGDAVNQEVIAALVKSLVALRRENSTPPYLDLRLGRDWVPEDLEDLAGHAGPLAELTLSGQPVVLGGRAPAWAYCAVMHRCLDRRSDCEITIFDPKVPNGFVDIADQPRLGRDAALADCVSVLWTDELRGGCAILDVRIVSENKFLPMPDRRSTAVLPGPASAVPGGDVAITGAIPIWLHLAYSRWLRSLEPRRSIGAWDARYRRVLWVCGPRSNRCAGSAAAGEGPEARRSGEQEKGDCPCGGC